MHFPSTKHHYDPYNYYYKTRKIQIFVPINTYKLCDVHIVMFVFLYQ